MKIPSFFKTTKHQKFEIVPRYYDPIKEDIDQRISSIKNEEQPSKNPSRIYGSFQKKSLKNSHSTSLIQLIIMVLLSFLIFGYIYLGSIALYISAIITFTLIYLRIKKII